MKDIKEKQLIEIEAEPRTILLDNSQDFEDRIMLFQEAQVQSYMEQQSIMKQYKSKVDEVPQPKGLATSIGITKLANRKGFTHCPTCKNMFYLNDKWGYFKCNYCANVKGNIHKFAELILDRANKLAIQSNDLIKQQEVKQ